MRADLHVWLDFLKSYNGLSLIQERADGPSYECGSDASSLGFSATFRDTWLQGPWPQHWLDKPFHIGVREVYPIWLVLKVFGSELQNTKLVFYCDNLGVVNSLNKLTSKCKLTMVVIREIVSVLLEFNIKLVGKFISTKDNLLNDSISRFAQDTPNLLRHFGMKSSPLQIPACLRPEHLIPPSSTY